MKQNFEEFSHTTFSLMSNPDKMISGYYDSHHLNQDINNITRITFPNRGKLLCEKYSLWVNEIKRFIESKPIIQVVDMDCKN
jgi:hypothetical protein